MIRVVVDTNVFVSSFFGGPPRKIVNLWKSGQVLLCLSKPIIEEYVEVLRRLALQDEQELGELLNVFGRGFHVVFAANTPRLNVVEDDPADNKFIECAVALEAGFIISGDKALTAIENYMGIKILTPRDFLRYYTASQD
ncbi:MAG: putative toxin-antitoxin system toxin component, PIN family [Planctomycetota bacterium]